MSSDPRQRIVVTGMGVISPIGLDLPAFATALAAGRSGVGPITRFDCQLRDPLSGEPQFATRIAAEVRGFDAALVAARPQRLPRASLFAIAAARQALTAAGLVVDRENARQVGIVVGTGAADLGTIEREALTLAGRGARRLSPTALVKVLPSALPANLAMHTGARGPSFGISSACASATQAIGEACWLLRRGAARFIVAGGAEAVVTPLTVGSFTAMRATSRRNDEPARASRPFDRDRDGFVIGEGAGILVLETLASARERGAVVLAEVAGCASTADAWNASDMRSDQLECARAMTLALAAAGVHAEEVDYVNAHGTSTPRNDVVETRAIHEALGARATRIPVSATKSMIGHLMSACGAVETIATVLALVEQRVHATVNLENADPQCDLDYVAGESRAGALEVALKNSFGLGGHNTSLVLRRAPVS